MNLEVNADILDHLAFGTAVLVLELLQGSVQFGLRDLVALQVVSANPTSSCESAYPIGKHLEKSLGDAPQACVLDVDLVGADSR